MTQAPNTRCIGLLSTNGCRVGSTRFWGENTLERAGKLPESKPAEGAAGVQMFPQKGIALTLWSRRNPDDTGRKSASWETVIRLSCRRDKRQKLVEAGGVGIFRPLKTRKLLIFRDAQNAQNCKIAFNWNVSGTRIVAAPGLIPRRKSHRTRGGRPTEFGWSTAPRTNI